MRRHVVLLAILAAIIVGIALLRSRPAVSRPPVGSRPPPVAPVEPPLELADRETHEAAPLPTRAPSTPTTAVQQARIPDPECILTVVNAAGDGVPGAVVLLLRHSNSRPSAHTKVEEKRANELGQVSIRMAIHEGADALAYMEGVGVGSSVGIKSQAEATLKLQAGLNVEVRCLGVQEVPLEDAEAVLTTEVFYGEQRDAYGNTSLVVVSLPPRKLGTKLDGSCRFEAVFAPARFKPGWRPQLGIRHRLTAEWNRMTAKLTIDKAPEGPVVLDLR